MGQAAVAGALVASSVLVGAVLVVLFKPATRVIGAVLAFGAGALISAVAYDLVADPLLAGASFSLLVVGLAAGALAFFVGDLLIDRRGGDDRRRMARPPGDADTMALFLGLLLDGIPESFIIGSTIVMTGAPGLAFTASVFVSNVPEAMATTSGFKSAGMSTTRIMLLWLSVVALSALVAAAGYAMFDRMSGTQGVFAHGFAAGALLTMLSDTMLPDALNEAGKSAGLFTVLGFTAALALVVV